MGFNKTKICLQIVLITFVVLLLGLGLGPVDSLSSLRSHSTAQLVIPVRWLKWAESLGHEEWGIRGHLSCFLLYCLIQGEVRGHIQLILKKLLQTVNQRVMILGQEHELSVSHPGVLPLFLSLRWEPGSQTSPWCLYSSAAVSAGFF